MKPGAVKDPEEVKHESIVWLFQFSAFTFTEVNIGLSAVNLNTDLFRCPDRH